jgi:hypothetical protein
MMTGRIGFFWGGGGRASSYLGLHSEGLQALLNREANA